MDRQVEGQVVGYVRVSSVDQNPARQYEAIGDVDKWFEDKLSGKTRIRPSLEAMLSHVRDGDWVKVSSMDRLARSVIDLHSLVDGLVADGVTVEFLKESVVIGPCSNRPMDRLLLTVLGGIAEFERSIIRERQAEGIGVAKSRGVYEKPLSLTPAQIDIIRQRTDLGVPKAVIARELDVSRSTVYNALAGRGRYSDA
ncbi:recombinase family protein [Brevibacterium aurantiacum]|uniref:Site-specific DNA recombinase n=1 Tax=Brevibacterium aurantiacum TaxID=273384 RepID=A0A2H1KTE2_BREAU|nr:recombinase family protein [Brevibacterium aurantiacum]SMY02878.1 Site-specific DNA recombinase [Brevibacterium aurantiacum]